MQHNFRTKLVLAAAALALVTAGHARADLDLPDTAPPCTVAGAPRTLADVLDLVGGSARAEAVAGDVAAATALEEQAAARLNPQLAVQLEDFTGSGRYSSFGQSETTVSVSQRIEIGGRRAQRVEVAARETGVERARGVQATLFAEVAAKQAFVALLAARKRRAISARGQELAGEVLGDARRRVEGGEGSVVDLERASMAGATAALAVSDADRAVEVAAQKLAGLWGGLAADAGCVDGQLTPAREASAPAGNEVRIPAAVAVAEAEVEVRRAEVAKERGESTPDLALAAGVRHLAGPGAVSLVTGVNVELPLFDRNAGNIRAAEQRLFAAQARARVARDEAAVRILRIRDAVEAARARAAMLSDSAIPSAERAFATLSRARREGAVSTFEVLEARRALVTLRLEHVDALAAFHEGVALLEGALGVVATRLEDSAPPVAAAPQGISR